MVSAISLHNSTSEMISSNEDLLTEILLRLPAKPLIRFKSVSKRWLALISDSRFSHRHTRLNPNAKVSGIFLRNSPAEFEFLSLTASNSSGAPFKSLDFVQDPAGIKILQSCNGLLLCSSFRKIGTNRNYYIYNPTTKQFSTLPSLIGDVSTTIFGVNLAFDPSKSPYYKVVCVRSSINSIYYYQIEIYSSENGVWRISGSPFVAPFDMVFDNGVFCNGRIHWISPTGASLYFDVDNECFGTMPALPIFESWGKRRFRYFGGMQGGLHLIEIYGSFAIQFKVFELQKDYSEWFVKSDVDLDAIVTEFPEMVRSFNDSCDSNYYAFVILSLVREEIEEDSSDSSLLLLLHIPGKVLSYNIKDKSFKKIFELEPRSCKAKGFLQFGWLDAYQYIETLACV